MMYGYGPTMGWMMPLILLLGLALVAAVVWVAVRYAQQPAAHGPSGIAPRGESPRDILDRRLAAGEIDPATYDEVRAKLAERR
ncbi:hypothetical protein R8Z50_23195 [Longispora sp. K20-0274]|uniref:hypothetical protein n=1 Tax=Longispora sp. K20-0274 TaxID=3088255 RepID=UPI00399AB088